MILIVDDTHEVVTWLVEAIRDDGYYADFARDVPSALYKFRRVEYVLALIDIILTDGADGNDLARQVKRLPEPFCHVPLIAMTGGAAPVDGAFLATLRKPFLPRQLREIIARYADPPIRELHIQRLREMTPIDPTPRGMKEPQHD